MPSTIIKPKGRGRPPTHPVDRLRTRIWFHVVKLRSGLPNAGAIELKVDGEHVRKRDVDVLRPTKWGFYADGEKVPDDNPDPRNAIEQAEASFSGSARWFRSPIWPVLRGEHCDRYDIDRALRQLQPDVVEILFESESREHETLPRPKSFDAECKARLVSLGCFDSLVASVLWVALSEEIASPELRETALSLYHELQQVMKDQPEISPFFQDLFSWIDKRCKHWVYLSPNQRMDVVIFWQGVQDNAEKLALVNCSLALPDDSSDSQS